MFLLLHFKLYVTLCAFYEAFIELTTLLHCQSHRDFSLAPASFIIRKNIKSKIVSVKTYQESSILYIYIEIKKWKGHFMKWGLQKKVKKAFHEVRFTEKKWKRHFMKWDLQTVGRAWLKTFKIISTTFMNSCKRFKAQSKDIKKNHSLSFNMLKLHWNCIEQKKKLIFYYVIIIYKENDCESVVY